MTTFSLRVPALSSFSLHACAAVLSAATIVLGGCASTGAPASGSMARYDELAAQPDGVRTYRSPRTGAYKQVDIDAADVRFADSVKISPEQAKEVAAVLQAALASHLLEAGLRGDPTGPRLRLRATVTAVETANPAINAISTVLLLAPVTRGGLTVEIEAADAQTGERVAAMAYEGKAGIKDAMRAYSTLGHATAEADRAAKRFAQLVSGTPVAAN